ncbi:hypothetical protein [Paenibacillus sp. Marseille-Q4541]|uniref:hypothetical protein n=1 Tax=Paenibacillus sp. Marseille-Q4541 TaxID=2831522 RepID=UPI001BADC7E7|nr:hypothetical protein [Paenibacillus sp. Marseille-Q4541]
MKRVIVFFLVIVITGCANKPNPVFLNEISLSEAYPGNISEIDKIELLDGSSGERKVIEEQVVIEQWISKIKDIELTPDDNQEGRVGYVYGISLYEGDEIKLGFIPNQINEIYYKTNTEFTELIRALFEEQFGKEF